MATSQLPDELLDRIASCLPLSDLQHFRLSSHAFARIATPHVFSQMDVLPTERSTARCHNILTTHHLKACVRRIIFHTAIEPDSWLYDWHNDYIQRDEKAAMPEGWYVLMSHLSRLPRLVHAGLHFSLECKGKNCVWEECPEMFDFRDSALQTFMAAVAAADGVRSLSIRNVQGGHDTTLFRPLLARLQSLSLQLTTEDEEAAWEHTPHIEATHDLFRTELKADWLQPVQTASLTQLVLFSARMHWGYYPHCDLHDIHFPALKRLALGKMAFARDSQLDWILAHGATLEHLVLDSCPIVFAASCDEETMENLPEGQPSSWVARTRWHHIFDRFRSGLPALKAFGLAGSGEMLDVRSFGPGVWSLGVELGSGPMSGSGMGRSWIGRMMTGRWTRRRRRMLVSRGSGEWSKGALGGIRRRWRSWLWWLRSGGCDMD